ncbi:MAG: helix-turn-helix transcriptional regulator [Defluviitaleaceae bacterium]|nr:helix-turn-helix transcriptional regulator [Defluviitaleaceae bacterium]
MQKNIQQQSKVDRRTVRKTNKSNLDKDVGARVRRLRKTLGFSVDRLAEILDITPSHVRLIEYGQRGVTLALCQKLCDTFNLTADYVIYGDARADENAVKGDYSGIAELAAASLTEDERACFAAIMKEYTLSRRTPHDAELLKEAMRAQLRSFFALKVAIQKADE